MNSLRCKLLLVIVVTTFSMSSLAAAQDPAQVDDQTGTWIDAGRTLVVVPKSRKMIAAYSVGKGTWARVEFDLPLDKEVQVTANGALAAFQTQHSVYAFSAATGTWGRLKLPMNSKALYTLDSGMVRVTDGNLLYVFGVNALEWSGIDLTTGQPLLVDK